EKIWLADQCDDARCKLAAVIHSEPAARTSAIGSRASPRKQNGRRTRRSGGLPGIPQNQFAIEMPPARVKVSLRQQRAARHYKCRSSARNMAHVALGTRKSVSGPGLLRAPRPPTWVVQVFLRPGFWGVSSRRQQDDALCAKVFLRFARRCTNG